MGPLKSIRYGDDMGVSELGVYPPVMAIWWGKWFHSQRSCVQLILARFQEVCGRENDDDNLFNIKGKLYIYNYIYKRFWITSWTICHISGCFTNDVRAMLVANKCLLLLRIVDWHVTNMQCHLLSPSSPLLPLRVTVAMMMASMTGATAIRSNSQDLEPAWDRLSCSNPPIIVLSEVHKAKRTTHRKNWKTKKWSTQNLRGPSPAALITRHQSTFPRWRFAPLGAAARDRHPWRQKRSGSSRRCKPSQRETFTAEMSKNVQKSHHIGIQHTFTCACM
jgi:hypothetical protein